MNELVGFMMTLEVAEDFYRRCIARNAHSEAERMVILNEIVNELMAIKLTKQDLKRQLKGKKILHVKRSDNESR